MTLSPNAASDKKNNISHHTATGSYRIFTYFPQKARLHSNTPHYFFQPFSTKKYAVLEVQKQRIFIFKFSSS